MLTLRRAARPTSRAGAIDTVVVAFTDMQGRLMGKRLHGEFFVEEIDARARRSRAATTCSRSRWRWTPCRATSSRAGSSGYGDFALAPDLATLRRIPWLEATALVLCDVALARRLAGRSPRRGRC